MQKCHGTISESPRTAQVLGLSSCSVPQLMNSVINWLSHSGAVVSSSGVLMLFGNHSINGRIFRCVVNSSQLHSTGESNIIITVKSKFLEKS